MMEGGPGPSIIVNTISGMAAASALMFSANWRDALGRTFSRRRFVRLAGRFPFPSRGSLWETQTGNGAVLPEMRSISMPPVAAAESD